MSAESAGGTGANTPITIQEPSNIEDNTAKKPQQQQQSHHHRFIHHGNTHDANGGRHRHFHHNGHRIRQFIRADGKKVHVASSPGEAEKMRRKMAVVDDDFDLVVHGSDEHVQVLRDVHDHHEYLHASLREKYGEDASQDFERVIRDLDLLGNELHNISEHAVKLDTNFEKYGYSAHLRTMDGAGSSSNSISGDDGHEHHDWNAKKHHGTSMTLFRKPIIRQYFHKGLIWRASSLQEVASYELFVDLLYVGIIDISGEFAAEEATGQSLLEFAITFILSWKFWSDIQMAISWFEQDDIFRRGCVLFVLACLLGFTTNITGWWENTYPSLIAFYLAARLFGATYFAACAYWIPMVRGAMVSQAIGNALPAALWIGSIHTDLPGRLALIWMAIFLDLFGGIFIIIIQRGGTWMPQPLRQKAARAFEFYPALNIEHKIERTGAFVTLVFGYSILSLLYQNRASFSINAFFGKAVLALVQAFAFNWMYFEVDSFNLHTHAIRRAVWSSIVWHFIHLPFIMAFVLASSALPFLVLAHDSINSDYHDLAHHYAERSPASILSGQRWFYCAGLGIALILMGVISLTHVHRTIPGQRISKQHRLMFRFLVGIVLVMLGFADNLDSLQLVGTTTSLVVLVLLIDLFGATSVRHNIIWGDVDSSSTNSDDRGYGTTSSSSSIKGGLSDDEGGGSSAIDIEKGRKKDKSTKHPSDRYHSRHRTIYTAKCKILRKDLTETLKAGDTLKPEDVAKGADHHVYEH